MGYSSQGCKEWDTTEQLTLSNTPSESLRHNCPSVCSLFHVKVNRYEQAVWNLKWCRKRASRQALKPAGFILPLFVYLQSRPIHAGREDPSNGSEKSSCYSVTFSGPWWDHLKVEDLGHHPKGHTILLPVSVLNFTMSCQPAHRSTGNRQPGVPALDNDSKSFWQLVGILLGFRKLFKLELILNSVFDQGVKDTQGGSPATSSAFILRVNCLIVSLAWKGSSEDSENVSTQVKEGGEEL